MAIVLSKTIKRLDKFGVVALVLAPVAFTLLTGLALLTMNRSRYRWIIREDGPVEWLTALVYAIAMIVALFVVTRLLSAGQTWLSALFVVFAFGMAFIAGEEASWGQRVLGFKTPEELASLNSKQEFNVHNLYFFPLHWAFICVGFYGAVGWLLFGPFLARIGPLWRDLLTVPPVLFFYFAIPAALYLYFEIVNLTVDRPEGVSLGAYLDTWFITGKEQELIELLLGCGFLLFAIHAALRVRHTTAHR